MIGLHERCRTRPNGQKRDTISQPAYESTLVLPLMRPPALLLSVLLLVLVPPVGADPLPDVSSEPIDHLPQAPPQNISYAWETNASMSLSWEEPPTRDGVQLVAYLVVEYTEGGQQVVAQIPPDKLSASLAVDRGDPRFFSVLAQNDAAETSPPGTIISSMYPPCGWLGLWLMPPPPWISYIEPRCLVPTELWWVYDIIRDIP